MDPLVRLCLQLQALVVVFPLQGTEEGDSYRSPRKVQRSTQEFQTDTLAGRAWPQLHPTDGA